MTDDQGLGRLDPSAGGSARHSTDATISATPPHRRAASPRYPIEVVRQSHDAIILTRPGLPDPRLESGRRAPLRDRRSRTRSGRRSTSSWVSFDVDGTPLDPAERPRAPRPGRLVAGSRRPTTHRRRQRRAGCHRRLGRDPAPRRGGQRNRASSSSTATSPRRLGLEAEMAPSARSVVATDKARSKSRGRRRPRSTSCAGRPAPKPVS